MVRARYSAITGDVTDAGLNRNGWRRARLDHDVKVPSLAAAWTYAQRWPNRQQPAPVYHSSLTDLHGGRPASTILRPPFPIPCGNRRSPTRPRVRSGPRTPISARPRPACVWLDRPRSRRFRKRHTRRLLSDVGRPDRHIRQNTLTFPHIETTDQKIVSDSLMISFIVHGGRLE